MAKEGTLKAESWFRGIPFDFPLLTCNRLLFLYGRPFYGNFNFYFALADYIEDSADRIPNEDRFCLPICMTKKEIYNNYVEDVSAAHIKPISFPTFCRMWKKKFPNVSIRKV